MKISGYAVDPRNSWVHCRGCYQLVSEVDSEGFCKDCAEWDTGKVTLIAPGTACTSTLGIPLAQSTVVQIPTGSYDYCATGTTAPTTGVVTFTVAWA